MKKYGLTFKEIRTSKNYRQGDVHKESMHQTTYSKFELGKIDVTSEKFEILLNNIEMSFEEFQFIHHSYAYSDRDRLINKFNDLKFIEVEKLKVIIALAESYLDENEDRHIRDILSISQSFLILKETESFEVPRQYAEKVWGRLEGLNTWYLSDLKLINSILFLFPIATAISITNLAITQANKYEKNSDYKKIILPFKFNLVHLLIREGKLEEAFLINEEVIDSAKELKSYMQISLSYLRKGILLETVFNQKSDYSKQALEIAGLLEDFGLQNQLTREEQYLKKIIYQ